jgi:hypothetical protein
MQNLFTIDNTKSNENALKNIKVIKKTPSVVIPVWKSKDVYESKLVGLHWVKEKKTINYKDF